MTRQRQADLFLVLTTMIAASLCYGERLALQKIIGGVLILLAQIGFRWCRVSRLPSKV
ncbi:hypothetical protein SAMN05192562_106198 [Kosakonia arachidis]|uniref:Uncharacterized protein n=1 Tax=Kosakonia arachidis TaxID=551989 RepID=A0A1I7DSK2_9ENTR|nr:hypothetical protein SAMN05192562_106198 [Kosakonia arachidis]